MSVARWPFLLSLLFSHAVFAEERPAPALKSEEVLAHYLEASQSQQEKMRGVTMDIDIAAQLPKMKKQGSLHALRIISKLGRITYDALKFEGDNTVKKEVIARFLQAETETEGKKAPPPLTPEHYKFKFKGLTDREGERVYVFQVSPRKKKPGTFRGELWLDPESFLPIREMGRLAKNPSIFVKRFEFVRKYDIVKGMAVPIETYGVVTTRLWGRAEMMIHYSNFHALPAEQPAAMLTGGYFDSCCIGSGCP